MIKMLAEMANGNAVAVAPINAERTTHQAADLLNVSRPHLVKLLEEGKLSYRMVGTLRKLVGKDVLNYREKIASERRAALQKMSQLDEEPAGRRICLGRSLTGDKRRMTEEAPTPGPTAGRIA